MLQLAAQRKHSQLSADGNDLVSTQWITRAWITRALGLEPQKGGAAAASLTYLQATVVVDKHSRACILSIYRYMNSIE